MKTNFSPNGQVFSVCNKPLDMQISIDGPDLKTALVSLRASLIISNMEVLLFHGNIIS